MRKHNVPTGWLWRTLFGRYTAIISPAAGYRWMVEIVGDSRDGFKTLTVLTANTDAEARGLAVDLAEHLLANDEGR